MGLGMRECYLVATSGTKPALNKQTAWRLSADVRGGDLKFVVLMYEEFLCHLLKVVQ